MGLICCTIRKTSEPVFRRAIVKIRGTNVMPADTSFSTTCAVFQQSLCTCELFPVVRTSTQETMGRFRLVLNTYQLFWRWILQTWDSLAMHKSLTKIKAKTRHCHLPRPCTLCYLYTADLAERKYLFFWYAKPLRESPRALSFTGTQSKASSLFLHYLCNSFPVFAVRYNLLLSVHICVHNPACWYTGRQTSFLSLSLTHLSHSQQELQVLKGNPPSSQSLLNGIINFLMSMNITQRQSHGYGGMLPANIHAIRIFGFTHPQPLLSAVLTAAKLSLLCWLGRPHRSGWLAWVLEDSWAVVHSLLLLTTKDRETLPAPVP